MTHKMIRLAGTLRISRPEGGGLSSVIEIEVTDNDARVTAFELTVELADFTRAITSMDWRQTALAPFEIDGWRARVADLDNHHRSLIRDGQHCQRVTFFRNVPKDIA